MRLKKMVSMKIHSYFAVLLPLVCAGCASQFTPANLQNTAGSLPQDTNAAPATIQGELVPGSWFWGDPRRVLIASIDGQAFPDDTVTPPKLTLPAGQHHIDVICQWAYGRNNIYISMDMNAESGHDYLVQCQSKSAFINIGTKFSIIDESDEVVVAHADGWGPTQNGRIGGPPYLIGQEWSLPFGLH
jgi:hypothetical protein